MSILTLQSVNKDFGIKEILREASFSLGANDKVGLIGTNGSGKSTLLKILAGLEPIDSGECWVNPNIRAVYLPQQPQLESDRTVLEQVFADSGEQMALVRQYEALSHQLGRVSGQDMDRIMGQLSTISEQMATAGAWELETKAKIILSKLGIEDFEAKVGTLSGGYQRRIALATALLSEPDVLLMDEPTNHLDTDSVDWLQGYLNQYPGAILLITHDRYFLDQVTTRILELDRGDLTAYAGNYAYYLEKKALAEDVDVSRQRKHRGLLRRELEWLKRGPKARSTKQKARIDRISDMQDQEFKGGQERVEISTPGRRIGKKVVELQDVSKSYGDRTLIQSFTYAFSPEDRIGVIGGNGVGKSTLLNIIIGKLPPDSGTVDMGQTIHIGYFDQQSETLMAAANQEQRVIEYLKDEASLVQTKDGDQITASQMLERFLFPSNQQYLPLHKLSGGEKRRLFLLRVLMKAPNLLILDEPTNDLDVQTLGVLEDYLDQFNGCVIIVSHDRYFLDRTVDQIFAFHPGGEVRRYPGNYSIYLDYRKQEDAETSPSSSAPKAVSATEEPTARKAPRPRKMSYNEKREFEHLEQHIPSLEAEKTAIEQQLYHNPPSGYDQVQSLSDRLAAILHEIEQSIERWMELSDLAS
ncbi:ABC-F family ATP-binding cassette domain-containing protein [Leptolyngbya sp. CCY15150]|uniref:ABC-F family ATP-binding cassette domain-containing protein n=1 Tax=Leptolyngbya sp. CCY15150 TaxID=2767772 RepID=UPI0019526007|nr:ABC-F family ATP-binding cassette domain-containing protein [Leptolyngbya sp. CCY15150]